MLRNRRQSFVLVHSDDTAASIRIDEWIDASLTFTQRVQYANDSSSSWMDYFQSQNLRAVIGDQSYLKRYSEELVMSGRTRKSAGRLTSRNSSGVRSTIIEIVLRKFVALSATLLPRGFTYPGLNSSNPRREMRDEWISFTQLLLRKGNTNLAMRFALTRPIDAWLLRKS